MNTYLHQTKSLDLNLLTALDALLTAGSVSGAAERMHLSTPAVSHTLARIREVLDDPILVRAGRRLVPTPRAVAMREPVRRLLMEARNLMKSGDGLQIAEIPREFMVRAPDGIAIVHGALLLAALREKMPLATLRFVPEAESESTAMREGRIDLDIGTVSDQGPEIQTSLLYEQCVVGAARTGHPLLASTLTLKRFASQQHVAITQRGRAQEAIDVALAVQGHKRKPVLTVPSAYGALMAAARSEMVACVPEPLARGVASSLGLEVFKLPLSVPAERIVQAWHPRFGADSAHQWLRMCVGTLAVTTLEKRASGRDGLSASRHAAMRTLGEHL
jgi:DNA-binding transcriptional LysR family regulator